MLVSLAITTGRLEFLSVFHLQTTMRMLGGAYEKPEVFDQIAERNYVSVVPTANC